MRREGRSVQNMIGRKQSVHKELYLFIIGGFAKKVKKIYEIKRRNPFNTSLYFDSFSFLGSSEPNETAEYPYLSRTVSSAVPSRSNFSCRVSSNSAKKLICSPTSCVVRLVPVTVSIRTGDVSLQHSFKIEQATSQSSLAALVGRGSGR